MSKAPADSDYKYTLHSMKKINKALELFSAYVDVSSYKTGTLTVYDGLAENGVARNAKFVKQFWTDGGIVIKYRTELDGKYAVWKPDMQ